MARAGLAFTPIGRGYGPVAVAPSAPVVAPPANIVLPLISGTVQIFATLSTTDGTWTGNPTSFAYQWYAGGVAIAGATASTLVLTATEVGSEITVRVLATNSVGSASINSAPTAAVAGPSIVLSPATVFEGVAVGTVVGTLSVPGTTGTPSFVLVDSAGGKFVLDGDNVETAQALDFETASTHIIQVSVTGVTPSVSSAFLVVFVTDVADYPVNIAVPTISGAAQVGHTLTATTGTWTGTPPPTYTYEWLANGTPIGNATSSSYLLTATELGKVVIVRVTATNNAGTGQAVSDQTATVTTSGIPTMTLSANTIAENIGTPTNIGLFTVTDVTGTPVYALVTNPGGLFVITANALQGLGPFDYETTTSYEVTVSVSGITPAIANATFTVFVTDVADAPVNTVSPVTSVSTLQVGQTVSVTNGTWSGDPNMTFTYQWYAQAIPISGATNSTYVLTSAELGKYIGAGVVATNTAGSTLANASPVLGFFTGGVQPADTVGGGQALGLLLAVTNSTGAGGGGTTYSAEAQQFFDRITDPGIPRKDLYATLVDGMVLDGTWPLIGGLYILATTIAGNALINLKSATGNLTAVGAPTFTADGGYTFNGTSQYLDTGVPFASFGLTQDSAHLGAVRGTAGTNPQFLWGRATTNGRYGLFTVSGGAIQGRLSASGAQSGSTVIPAIGHMIANRVASLQWKSYDAGVVKDTLSSTSSGTGTDNAWIGANTIAAGTIGYTNNRIDAVHCGAGLTDGQAAAIYARMHTYLVAVGSQV
jgi:hypothetical protein